MPILSDPAAGRTLPVDIVNGQLLLPADLASSSVQDGLPVTWRRTKRPGEYDVEAILSDIPGDGAPRQDVIDWLDEAAETGRLLQLDIAGIPTAENLMVGDRVYSTVPGFTTTRLRISLAEVRVVTNQRGTLPLPRADLVSGRSAPAELGECATEPASPEQAADGALWAFLQSGL